MTVTVATFDELPTRAGLPPLGVWPPDTKLYVRVGDVVHEIVGVEIGPVFGSAFIVAEPRVVESLARLA